MGAPKVISLHEDLPATGAPGHDDAGEARCTWLVGKLNMTIRIWMVKDTQDLSQRGYTPIPTLRRAAAEVGGA